MSEPNSDDHINLVERLESIGIESPLLAILKDNEILRDEIDAFLNDDETASRSSAMMAALVTRVGSPDDMLSIITNSRLRFIFIAATHIALAEGFIAGRRVEVA